VVINFMNKFILNINYMTKKSRTKIFPVLTVLAITISIINTKIIAQEGLPNFIVDNPSSAVDWSAENRQYSGVPSMAISPGGRFWAAWIASFQPAEDEHMHIVVATSGDRGNTWKEVFVLDPDGPGPIKGIDPRPWIDPNGKLWLFWTLIEPNVGTGVWFMTTSDPDSENPLWSEPARFTDGTMLNKPLILSSGEWVFKPALWRTKNGVRVLVSADQGKNWHIRGTVDVPEEVWNCDEHMIVERKDGSLWMLVRTIYGIGESTSHDRGVTWKPLTPSNIENPTARFFIRRLNSGNLLLVKNGPMDMRVRRQHLMAYISKDDGNTWSRGLLLDGRLGVSYPDGQQVEDGTIYIIYDFDRKGEQHILMTSFREEDVISGTDKTIVEVWQRRRIVNQVGPKH
jgi:hypothetical protein